MSNMKGNVVPGPRSRRHPAGELKRLPLGSYLQNSLAEAPKPRKTCQSPVLARPTGISQNLRVR